MKWFNKFKVGQEVRVVKSVSYWRLPEGGGSRWNRTFMDKTIGKVYKIVEIKKCVGYRLSTQIKAGHSWGSSESLMDFWYPVESLSIPIYIGQQLLFDFMSEAT